MNLLLSQEEYTESYVVANGYKADSLKGYQFKWNGCMYSIESAPYKLIVKQTNGDVYCSLDVDSYYDCGIVIGNILFWGERLGKISGFNSLPNKYVFVRT